MNSVSMCKINYIKDIDVKNIKPSRSGAIVYTLYKNKIYFILGIDTKSGDITDFGGGVSLKREDVITGGLRELSEESLGIFGNISKDEVKNCLAVYDENNIIIFIRIDIDITSKYHEFKSRLKCVNNPEVKDIKFYDKKNFIDLFEGNSVGNIMYDRIRNLLSTAKNKYEFLRYL